MKKNKSKTIIALSLLAFIQSCTIYKPSAINFEKKTSNNIEIVIVNEPAIKQRASVLTWMVSISLVPLYGIGLFPLIYCASSARSESLESDEDVLKWAKLYGKKNNNKYIVMPINRFKVDKKTYQNIEDYSQIRLITSEAEMGFTALTPTDVEDFKQLFPKSPYSNDFVKRTAFSADESTLLKLIQNYSSSPEIGYAKKRYILYAKFYTEFSSRLDSYNLSESILSKDEKAKKASSMVKDYESISDYAYRFGRNTNYDDVIFGNTYNSAWVNKQQLETIINWYPNTKHRELAISRLIDETNNLNELQNYLSNYSTSTNVQKIKEKINRINGLNLANESKEKTSPDYRKDYKTIKIGKYKLMATNLDVTHYRNGDPIRKAQSVDEWKKITQEERNFQIQAHVYSAYCDHPKGAEYGKLYNWTAFADERNIAPEGWRDPTEDEWAEIFKIIKSDINLKKYFNNSGYRNLSGLYNYGNGYYEDTFLWLYSKSFGMHRQCLYISTTENSLNYYFYNRHYASKYRGNGLSIRLIRDN